MKDAVCDVINQDIKIASFQWCVEQPVCQYSELQDNIECLNCYIMLDIVFCVNKELDIKKHTQKY